MLVESLLSRRWIMDYSLVECKVGDQQDYCRTVKKPGHKDGYGNRPKGSYLEVGIKRGRPGKRNVVKVPNNYN